MSSLEVFPTFSFLCFEKDFNENLHNFDQAFCFKTQNVTFFKASFQQNCMIEILTSYKRTTTTATTRKA